MMKNFYSKYLMSTLAIFYLAGCAHNGLQQSTADETTDTPQLRETEIKVVPSILRTNNIIDEQATEKELSENNNDLSLKVTSVPDLGGIHHVLDKEESTLELDGEAVTFVADQLSIKEFSHKVFNELLNLNYVLAPELAASKTSLTLNISTPISRTEFYVSVNEILSQNKISTYRKSDILYLANASGNNKKNNIALGIGINEMDVPDISGQITHIVPYTYSESRNISSIMKKLATAKVTINSGQKLIILEGERDEIVRALKIINMLDVPRAFGRKIRLFEFAHMAPEEAIEQISSLLIEDGFSINNPGDISFVPMTRINSFVAYAASEAVIDRIGYWARKLDVPLAGDQKQYFVYKPNYVKAQDMQTALNGLLSGSSTSSSKSQVNNKESRAISNYNNSNTSSTQFSLDKQQNALIFNTTPIEYKKILSLLEKIDVLPGQVILDVTILEVTLTDDVTSGMNWFYDNIATNDDRATLSFLGSGAITGIFTSGKWESNLNWSEAKDDARVISRPYLIVKDGESASISSGDQIPIITQVVEDIGNTGSISNSVQYRSTGVNVSLSPTINSNGVISLSVSMSVSSSKASTDTQVQTPTIINRSINTEIISRNGQTVALGGLIREDKNDIENGVPGFRKLPLLGKLFSSTTDTFSRTELIMLITTKIVRDSTQVDEFSEAMSELYSAPIVIK